MGHPGSDITDSPIYVDNINLSRSHAFVAAEIENKSKACSNASYQCSAMRVDGFKYCIQHILQDKAAPYTQCAYTFPLSSHRCPLAAPQLYRTNEATRKCGGTLYVRLLKNGTEDEEVNVESMSLDPLSELLKQGYVS